jgi:hypothetical protein
MHTDPNLPEWTGPISLACERTGAGTKTVGYKFCRYPDTFFYAAREFLRSSLGDGDPPERLLVILQASPFVQRGIVFRPQKYAPRTLPDLWEFDVLKECGNVIRYIVVYCAQSYNLYVPKEVFQGCRWPGRIAVQLSVPE